MAPPTESSARRAFAIDRRRALASMVSTSDPSRFQRFRFFLLDSELHCVAVYRLGQFARETRESNRAIGMLATVAHRVVNRFITHIDHTEISTRARIGPGLVMMHRYSVIIGPAIIGKNCVLHHNVTIGQRVAKGDHGVPSIGDNVWIGPGAVLTGAIRIGDNVTISAGSVLSKDVPPRCLVAGNPARIVAHDYDRHLGNVG